MNSLPLPDEIRAIAQRLADAGFQAVVVGGSVRDFCLGRAAKDWDLATDATPQEMVGLFPATKATTRFGTAIVPVGDELIEVTTFRTEEGYSDFRRPDTVTYTGDLATDLARRDFTMNALAYDPIRDEIIDPYGGLDDLRTGLIRAVGEPAERFGEDALRLLRAVRFVAQLGFRIESKTALAVRSTAPLLAHLAPERIGMEMDKLITGSAWLDGLRAAAELDLLARALPPLAGADLRHALDVAGSADDLSYEGRFAALLHETDATAAQACLADLDLGNDVAAIVADTIRASMTPDTRSLGDGDLWLVVRSWSGGLAADALAIRSACGRFYDRDLAGRIERLSASGLPRDIGELAIGGADLIGLGMRPGPAFGRILSKLLDEVAHGTIVNEREALLRGASRSI